MPSTLILLLPRTFDTVFFRFYFLSHTNPNFIVLTRSDIINDYSLYGLMDLNGLLNCSIFSLCSHPNLNFLVVAIISMSTECTFSLI